MNFLALMTLAFTLSVSPLGQALPLEKAVSFLQAQTGGSIPETYTLQEIRQGSASRRTLSYQIGEQIIKEVEVPELLYRSLLKDGQRFAVTFQPKFNCGHSGLSLIELKPGKKESQQLSKKTFCQPPSAKLREWKKMQDWFARLTNYGRGKFRP